MSFYPTYGYTVINRKNSTITLDKFFTKTDLLGSGTYGKVFSVYLKEPAIAVLIKKWPTLNTKNKYVLKTLYSASKDDINEKCTKFSCEQIPNLLKELKIIDYLTKELKSNNIIKTYGCFFYIDDRDKKYTINILMEYGGDYNLNKIITSKRIKELTTIIELLYNLMELYNTMEHMHNITWYHRDIKLQNIVYNIEKKCMKFVDFGKACNIKKFKCRDKGGTNLYNLPQADLDYYKHKGDEKLQESIDRYAFALTTYFIIMDGIYKIHDIKIAQFKAMILKLKLPFEQNTFIERKIIPALKLNRGLI